MIGHRVGGRDQAGREKIGTDSCHPVSTPVHRYETGVKRLIFVSSMGIYDEVPGERYRSVLDPCRDSAAVIDDSDLDCTILRPGWFTRDDEVDCEITQKGEPFKGHDVSLNSLPDLIAKLSLSPGMEIRRSLGVSRSQACIERQ
jgi:hypothetical protein